MATIISVSNQKGGVGKTVTSVNLSAGLARHGKRILLVDVDAQGSATLSLGYNPDDLSITLANVIQNMINDISFEPTNGILHHEEGIDLLPANITLSVTELSLMNAIGRETILKKYLEMVQKSYDFIILDCLPSLNILAINALTASNQVIIPVQAQHLSVNGMQQLLATIAKIRRYLNPTLEIAGILPTMINARTKSMRDIMDLLHTTYDYLLEETQKFPYYPIPKALFTDTRYLPLSTYAKILYGFLLDCVSLSCEHQWIDKENHTYIYFTSKEAENLLHCSERKVSSLFSELKKAGLIQRKIQGQNKPARIYVMNFIKKISLAKDTPLVKACRKFKSMDMQVLPSGHAKITNQTRNFFQPDMQKLPTEYANFTNQTRKNCRLDMQKLPTGHASFTTNMNNTNFSNTNLSNTNSNNTNFNNTDLQQQQEKTVVAEQKKKLFFIKESLSDFEIKKILETANNDIELIREKYQIMEGQNINNIVGFLLSAIKRDFRPSQKKVKRNGFVNYEQRNDWDFEKIERLERKLLQREIEKTKNMIEFGEIIEDIDMDMRQKEIKAKVDYKNLLLLFPYAKEKIDTLIKILAVLSLDNTYAFITYEDKLFSKNTALEVVKRLDYNSIINIITNHFGETVHDIFLKLDKYQNK